MKLPLPLPWEIVSADISQYDNEGARELHWGGWWGMTKASSLKDRDAKCREYGDREVEGSGVGRYLM